MISASRPWLPKITVVETGFLISQEPAVPVNIPQVGPSSFHQAVEDEGGSDQPEEGFGVFDLVYQFEDPSGDIGDPALSEAELSSIGTSFQAEMGLKRKPLTPLLQLLEGQPGKDTQGTPQPDAPSLPPWPPTIQTRSSSTKSQPQSPHPELPASSQPARPPRPEGADSKRKRSPKGKEVTDGGKSQPSKEKLKSKLLKARERGLRPSPYRVPGFLPQCFTGVHYWKRHP